MVQVDEPPKRERRRTSSVVSARGKKTPPQSAERNYHRFADWLCERHGIAETEAKQVWTSLAREIDEWINTEHPRGVTKTEAVSQGIRRRMKLPDPRIVVVETHRGGRSRSLYEVRGRRFDDQRREAGFALVHQADPEPEPAAENIGDGDAQHWSASPNGIMTQIETLVERAARADEAETKKELVVEMLEDASRHLGELCDAMQASLARALDELR